MKHDFTKLAVLACKTVLNIGVDVGKRISGKDLFPLNINLLISALSFLGRL